MMGHREPLKSAAEFDAVARRRKHWPKGALRTLKRALSKRARRQGRAAMRSIG